MGIEPTTFSLGSGPLPLQINAMREKPPHRPLIEFNDLTAGGKIHKRGAAAEERLCLAAAFANC